MSKWPSDKWDQITRIIDDSDYDYDIEFIEWLYANRDVWVGFVNKTLQAHKFQHRARFGAKAILEILRWETSVRDADVTFKINNNVAPDLARLVMDCKPSLKGYFQIRGSAYRNDAYV